MADPSTFAATTAGEPAKTDNRWRPYRAVLASRLRSQRSYRTSFRFDMVGAMLAGLVQLGEIWVVFHNAKVLGGLDFNAILLVFGLANAAWAIAEVAVGHVDSLPALIRAGTVDVYYLRPQPLLAQLITGDIQLRRLARVAVGLICVVAALIVNPIQWTVATVVMLAFSLLFGTVIFACLFVTAAGLQFFLINGSEATNAFVYGGSYASQQPAAIWPGPMKIIFGFLFPMAFCAYLPALQILGLPGSPLLPAWLAWLLPVAAAWAVLAAGAVWRIGVRHYQGGGG
ncbi:ABC transporter permease [Nakamurella aerolata]